MNMLMTNSLYKEGYGIVAKKAMRDKNLNVEAKAIYSYICSFAGSGATSFPGMKLMIAELGISEKRFYKFRKQLLDFGYITILKQRNGNRRENNLYMINQEPEKVVEELKKCELENNEDFEHGQFESVQSESVQSESVQSESVQSESVQNVGTNSNSLNSNSLNSNSIKSSSSSKEEIEEEENEKRDLKIALDLCQRLNVKLSAKNLTALLSLYGLDKVLKSINVLASTSAFENGEIKNIKAYITKILVDNEQIKKVTNNITVNKAASEDKKGFNNYKQREYDYNKLQDELFDNQWED